MPHSDITIIIADITLLRHAAATYAIYAFAATLPLSGLSFFFFAACRHCHAGFRFLIADYRDIFQTYCRAAEFSLSRHYFSHITLIDIDDAIIFISCHYSVVVFTPLLRHNIFLPFHCRHWFGCCALPSSITPFND